MHIRFSLVEHLRVRYTKHARACIDTYTNNNENANLALRITKTFIFPKYIFVNCRLRCVAWRACAFLNCGCASSYVYVVVVGI